jgi:hypothetical protein
MGSFCEGYTPTDVVLRRAHLKSSITKLLNLLRDVAHGFSGAIFTTSTTSTTSGRCLLFLDDEEAARIALEQDARLENGTVKHEAFCSWRDLGTKIVGKRYVCCFCPGVDLCHSCKEKYDSGASIPGCEQHEFLSVPKDTSNGSTLEALGLSIEDWLEQPRSKYA